MKNSFPITPELTAIAIGYKNNSLIADNVLPIVPVGKIKFSYFVYDPTSVFTVPNTLYPAKGKPVTVELKGTKVTESVEDYGLQDMVSNDDIINADPNIDIKKRKMQFVTDLLLLDRELRTAGLVFNPANYASDKQQALSGSSQFNDPTSKPIDIIKNALDSCYMRPNTMTIGRRAWSTLTSHPQIVAQFYSSGSAASVVTKQQLAELFELKTINVGEAFVNVSKPGVTPEIRRAWGNHISLTYLNPVADADNGVTFGFTAQYQTRLGGEREEDAGARGSVIIRSWMSVKELIVAPDVGYLIQNVIAS